MADLTQAADLFRPIHERTCGVDGCARRRGQHGSARCQMQKSTTWKIRNTLPIILFRLDIGGLDDGPPLLDFGLLERGKDLGCLLGTRRPL